MFDRYSQAHEYLQHGRYKGLSCDRPLPYPNTRLLIRECDDSVIRDTSQTPDIQVCYWDTDIVIYHPDDTVTITIGNWPTQSTVSRINSFAHGWLRRDLGYVWRYKGDIVFSNKIIRTTPVRNIKCGECHGGWEDPDFAIIARLDPQIKKNCWGCNNKGRRNVGGIRHYQAWSGRPIRLGHDGRILEAEGGQQ
jgi:hypothetical protein